MNRASAIFYDSLCKTAGWGAGHIIIPEHVTTAERKLIIQRVKQEMPDAEMRLTPHGLEIYPVTPDEDIDKLERIVKTVNPNIRPRLGAAASPGGSNYRAPHPPDVILRPVGQRAE